MAHKRSNKDEALDRAMGFRVYRRRSRKGWTVKHLAELAGVHPNTISKVENGGGGSVSTVSRIAAALEVSAGKLIPNTQDVVSFCSKPPLFE